MPNMKIKFFLSSGANIILVVNQMKIRGTGVTASNISRISWVCNSSLNIIQFQEFFILIAYSNQIHTIACDEVMRIH